jgi:2,4-dienoyl-CoA reductase-like NADH-dependent reductase (Old Yellow Enzyme family)
VGSVTLDSHFKHGRSEAVGGAAASSVRSANVKTVLRLLDAGEFDLIAVGRSLIAHPDWVHLVREGRLEELRPFTVTT